MRRLGGAILCLALAVVGLAHAGPSVLDSKAAYPEGPLVAKGGVFVAEMGIDQVSFLSNRGTKSVYWAERGCGPTSVAAFGDGRLILCHLSGQVVALDREAKPARRWAQSALGQPLRNPNDSFADDRGGVYFSDPGPFSKESNPVGAVYRLDADGVLTRVAEGLWYPNGVYFDPSERQLYISEHLARRVVRYAVSADGTLGPMQVFADIDAIAPAPRKGMAGYREAGPDGLERAPNGDLVVAIYGEGRLLQLTPEGRLRRVHQVDVRFVTNLAFLPGGAAVVVGAARNDRVPFWGEVVRLPANAFALK